MNTTFNIRLCAIAASTAVTCLIGSALLPPRAGAQPVGFPDLNQFRDVDAGQYVRPFSYAERWANVYLFFKTPEGLDCAIGPSTWCTGDIPGLSANQRGSCSSVHQEKGDQPFTFSASDKPCEPTTDKVLSAGEQLTDWLTGNTCVVGENQLTACINAKGAHGFVLQPSGSRVF